VLTGYYSGGNASQTLVGPDGELNVLSIGKTAYLKGGAAVLKDALKLSSPIANANAGKWIEMTQGDTPYETVLKTLLPASELTPYIPVSGFKVGSATTLHGYTVVPVSGTAESTNGAVADATLFVSTSSPYLPISGSLTGTGDESGNTELAVFSWGKAIPHQNAPTSSVSYSSLTTT
jgi:hypothetical protein